MKLSSVSFHEPIISSNLKGIILFFDDTVYVYLHYKYICTGIYYEYAVAPTDANGGHPQKAKHLP